MTIMLLMRLDILIRHNELMKEVGENEREKRTKQQRKNVYNVKYTLRYNLRKFRKKGKNLGYSLLGEVRK